MARIRHSSEQIIAKLREAEVLLGQVMKVDQAMKLKELEKENARLKKLVRS